MQRHLDTIIEKGVLFLLIFTPLAFGSAERWSGAVMEIGAFVVFSAWVIKIGNDPLMQADARGRMRSPLPLLLIFGLAFAGLSLLQVVPLPESVLSVVSPRTIEFYKPFAALDGAWRTISVHPDATIDQFFHVLAYLLVFVVIVHHYTAEDKLKALFRTIVVIGCVLAVQAALQKAFWNGNVLWMFHVGSNLNPVGTYINKNHFAGYMEMAAPVALGLYLYEASKMKRWTGKTPLAHRIISYFSGGNSTVLSIALVAVLVLIAALFATLSRGAIIGFSGSMFLFLSMVKARRSLRKQREFIAFLFGMILLTVVAAGWSMVEGKFEQAREQGAGRFGTWRNSLSLIRDYPLLGAGLGTFDRIYPAYQTEYPNLLFEHAENDYIEVLTDLGITGFLALLGMMLVFYRSVLARWRERHNSFVICSGAGGIAATAAMAIHSFGDFNMRVPANALLLTVIAAATYAAVFHVSKRSNVQLFKPFKPFKPLKPLKLLKPGLILFIMGLLVLHPVRTLLAEWYHHRASSGLVEELSETRKSLSVSEKTIPNYLAAIRSFETAFFLSPSHSDYPKAIAELYLRLGSWASVMELMKVPLPEGIPASAECYSRAVERLRRGVMLDPANADLHYALGRLEDLREGEPGEAEKELDRAIAAFPINAPLRYAVAIQHLNAGRQGHALEHATMLAKIGNTNGYAFKAMEIAWRASGDAEVVKGLCAENPKAWKLAQRFLEYRGIPVEEGGLEAE